MCERGGSKRVRTGVCVQVSVWVLLEQSRARNREFLVLDHRCYVYGLCPTLIPGPVSFFTKAKDELSVRLAAVCVGAADALLGAMWRYRSCGY